MANKKNYLINLFSIIFLASTILLFYFPTLNFDFVWDDKELYINPQNIPIENPFAKIGDHFIPKKDKMYIPITYIFWSLVSYFGGIQNGSYSPYYFHFFNVILHILNSILVFYLLKSLLNSGFGAFIGAIFFALHPIQIEGVAWVSESRGLLSALFGLSAIYYFSSLKNKNLYSIIILCLLLLLSILSKPSGIVFPLLFPLIDWYKNKRQNLLQLLARNWYFLILTLPFIIISFQAETTKVVQYDVPLIFRPFVWLNAIGFYIQKILLPLDLSPGYGLSFSFLKNNLIYFYHILIIIGVIVFGAFLKIKREFFFSLLFFVVAFLPISNLVSFYYQYWSTVSDRYVYFSLVGISFFFGFVAKEHLFKYKYVSSIILICLFYLFSNKEIAKWKDEFSLWNDCINKYPNRISQVYLGRGMELEARGDINAALADYSKSIEIDSNFYFGYYNRGNVFYDLKMYNKAINDYSKTVQLNSKYVNAYVNRGLCFLETKQYDKAINDFQYALKLDSTQADVYAFIAEAFEYKNDIQNAIYFYEKALSFGTNYTFSEKVRILKLRSK